MTPVAKLDAPGPSGGDGPDATPIVEAVGVTKRFGSTTALADVNLRLHEGRCLGLVGRNGAGKSTLVSLLSGIDRPTHGEVRLGGHAAPPLSDRGAWGRRIATVYQHSMVVPTLTVAENMFLNDLPGPRARVSWRDTRARARRMMAEWGFEVDVDQDCANISVEQRQVVEIARSLATGTRCLLLDEPTAALERSAIERLFERVRQVIDRGVAVLYISHHLEEVFDICHDVVVLRDGAVVAEAPTGEFSEQSLVEAMVGTGAAHAAGGRSRPRAGPDTTGTSTPTADGPADGPPGPVPARLEMQNVSAPSPAGSVEDVTLEIAPGERLGVTGLQGSGATTLGRLVAGAVKPTSGRILVDGDVLAAGRPDLALRAGVGYVPEDRHAEGYVSDLGVAENMTMTIVDTLARHGVLRRRAQADAARPLVAMLDVVTSNANQPVGELSGGNQQKAVVGRALARSPRLVVALTPTRGVDVASKAVLLEALVTQTEERGASFLLATDEIDDLAVCDRVIVMVGGRVFKEFTDPPWDREALIAASEGLDAPAPASPQPASPQPASPQPAGPQPAGPQPARKQGDA